MYRDFGTFRDVLTDEVDSVFRDASFLARGYPSKDGRKGTFDFMALIKFRSPVEWRDVRSRFVMRGDFAVLGDWDAPREGERWTDFLDGMAEYLLHGVEVEGSSVSGDLRVDQEKSELVDSADDVEEGEIVESRQRDRSGVSTVKGRISRDRDDDLRAQMEKQRERIWKCEEDVLWRKAGLRESDKRLREESARLVKLVVQRDIGVVV
jgi:hypothetical protein